MHELHTKFPRDRSSQRGPYNVLRSGCAEWAAVIPDEWLIAAAREAEHRRVLHELGMRSYICVPLLARDVPRGVLTFVMADSNRRYDAADLRAAEDLAQRAVIALENAGLYRALKEADRRKDEFLATLAHELRNPLAPLRNGLHLLKLARHDAATTEQARAMMERQLAQMVRLIDDLLDLSRISRGKITLKKERLSLASIVHQALETSRPVIEQAGHELTLTLPPDPLEVDADPVRLAQVFSNLLNNAAKFTQKIGHIWLTVQRQGDAAIVSVRDNGVGIPVHLLPRIFEMFTQAERPLEHVEGGLGIGLSLVKGLVEMHGGSVAARSDGSGKGSEFIVHLPLAAARPQAPALDTAAAARPNASHRILVVDDNRDAAVSLAALLGLMGHETAMAHDGFEALDAAAAFEPGVILLDLRMPNLNGLEAARRLRALPCARHAVLVALTGWGQDDDRRRSQEAGFDFHLVKPVEPAALEELLAAVPAVRPALRSRLNFS